MVIALFVNDADFLTAAVGGSSGGCFGAKRLSRL